MAVAMGQRGAVGLGREQSWGSPVNPTCYLEVFLSEVRSRVEVTPVETARGNRSHRGAVLGPVLVRGPMQGPVSAEGIGTLLHAAFGAVQTTLLAAGGGGNPPVYQHVFTRQTGSDLPSYTIEQNLGGLASLQACGCRADELTLGIPRSGLVTFQAEWVGADEGSMTPTSPTFPSDEFLHYRGFDALLEGVSAGDIEEAEVTFANNLVTGLVGAGGNARVTRLPAASFTVTGRMVVSAEGPSFELAYSAGETFELTLAVTGDLLQGVHRRKLAIALPRVQLTEAAVPLAPGRLAHEVEFLALLDPTQGMEASVTLISSVAAYG